VYVFGQVVNPSSTGGAHPDILGGRREGVAVTVPRQHTDGRVARGARTREAVLAAHTALLREGVLKPTGKVLAERAGVSLRAVWLNFKDFEGLLEETAAYWLRSDAELRPEVDASLPLDARIDVFCAMRTARLENLAPAARSSVLGEPFSPALQRARRKHVRRVEDDVEAAFGPELDRAGDARDVLAKGLFVAASWPSWASLRDDLGLDVEQATAVMRHTVAALLDEVT
jgi:TetR/AcrR family transcriptional regulator of autoinduction and epiphytic fitness